MCPAAYRQALTLAATASSVPAQRQATAAGREGVPVTQQAPAVSAEAADQR